MCRKGDFDMRRLPLLLLPLLYVVAPSSAQDAPKASASEKMASGMNHGDMIAPATPQLLPGYGSGGFPITTRNPRAQAFFDNGMQLAHAFAHTAAIAAMAEAARLDPGCAMCLWGQAWASGPTINYGKTPEELRPLAEMVDKAAALAKTNGTDRERALIHALQLRYADGGGGKPGDLAFAKAMMTIAQRYPKDNEVAVIAADAWLMTEAKTPDDGKINAELAMPLLEAVLARSPNDTGAIHFYIHATEAAGVPALAERYADRLAALAPKASHLIHMPSHTYYWVGRYQDAADANMRAVEVGIADAKALGTAPPQGVWGLPYHMHNVTYGLGGALEAGDAKIALALGRPLVARSQGRDAAGPFSQVIAASGYFAMARFADPKEVLALPRPKLPILVNAWHYARGEALARQGDATGVRAEAMAIATPVGKVNDDDGSRVALQLTFLARNVLLGRAAMLDHRFSDAAVIFKQAADMQEGEEFSLLTDPPAWYYPIRYDLATALLAAGDRIGAKREAQAALVYRVKDPATLALLGKISGN
jgi:tetratricopeptide (TPR) repeat protein